MRLWSLHPRYLDARGLVALWREALLAQAVLRNETRGYKHHPQLQRFRESPAPHTAIACYLQQVHREATTRGYHFDADKIGRCAEISPLAVSRGQLAYEWEHLVHKLQARDPTWLARIEHIVRPQAHPLFHIVPGDIASWEVVK